LKTVYFIHQLGSNFVKIGCSNNLKKRLETLKTANPNQLEIIFTTTEYEERNVHHAFNIYHHKGEWYEIPNEIIQEIKQGVFPPKNISHQDFNFKLRKVISCYFTEKVIAKLRRLADEKQISLTACISLFIMEQEEKEKHHEKD